jgi:hypothetical protein
MNLFDKIPENFFSILVSKNKNLYIDALFVLRDAFKQEMSISKENIISRLINSLEDEINQEDFSEDENVSDLKDNNITGKAYFLLRKLEWAGWIEREMQRDSFEEFIILPDYSIKFINLLYSFTEEKQVEYNSYVFATYTALKFASTEKNETYNAVITAYNNTIQLIDELKSVYNSLGRFHRKMCNQDDVNNIISQHFFEYKEYSDEMIFPRFTRDSVPRYRLPIIELLTEILADEERLQNAINVAYSSKRYKTKEDAENDILNKIRTISEIYENIGTTMNEIETKNNDYVRASVKRIQYLLTNDKELKGKLVHILKNSKNEQVIDKMIDQLQLSRQEYLSNDSVYIRTKNTKKQGKSMPVKQSKPIDSRALYDFAKSLENMYSNKTINEFMEKNFKNKPFISSSEIELNTTEDLILLILSTIKADKSSKSFYYIEDSDETINNNGYLIPNIKFIRRS